MYDSGHSHPHAPPTAEPSCGRVGTVISRPVKMVPTGSCVPAYARCERWAFAATGHARPVPTSSPKGWPSYAGLFHSESMCNARI